MDFSVVRNALVPADDAARAKMAELAIGETVRVRVIQSAPAFRDYVHMIVARIGRARGMAMQNVGGWLAVATGHFDLAVLPRGTHPIPIPHSLAGMTAVEFEAFWEDARAVILDQVLPLLDPADADDVRALIEERRK